MNRVAAWVGEERCMLMKTEVDDKLSERKILIDEASTFLRHLSVVDTTQLTVVASRSISAPVRYHSSSLSIPIIIVVSRRSLSAAM